VAPFLYALAQEKDKLSPQERRIADFILSSPAQVVHMGIKELAEQCGTSPATVTRFCKVFHLKGYPDLKVKLSAELAHTGLQERNQASSYQDIVANNPLSKIVEAMEANHLTSIRDTTQLLDMNRLSQAIRLLCDAQRIDLYGVATSSVVALDFYQKLIRIGKNCTAFADPHMQITSASTLTDRDVAIAISYSGETEETISALSCAKDSGAATITLTSYGSNTLASMADIPLFVSSLEEGMRRGDMASRIAQLHIIDILFMGMSSEQFGQYVPKLEQSYQNVRNYRKTRGGYSKA